MTKADNKRLELARLVAGHLLDHGLADCGIRTLAAAAATSDRMLIYYFGSKEALVEQALGVIADGMAAQLDAEVGGQQRSADALYERLLTVASGSAFQPTIRLWFELVGMAVRGEEPYRSTAERIGRTWLTWIEGKLPARQRHQAEALFARLEGRLMMQAIGMD